MNAYQFLLIKRNSMIFKKVYEDVVLRFWKLILFFIISIVILLSFQIKNLAIEMAKNLEFNNLS